MEEKLWTKFDNETTKETTIFGETGIIRITHFSKQTNGSPVMMLRGFIELNDDKLDYIIPYKLTDFNN